MKLKFKDILIAITKYVAYVAFAASIASIPIFSFNSKLFLLTWVIVGIMLLDMTVYILLKGGITVDWAVAALILFAFSAFISSALNRFSGFNFTPILLPIATAIIYLFSKQSLSPKIMLLVAFFGICVFLAAFIFHYRSSIIHLDFSQRLGGYFGDENDIAILLGFGFVYSFYSSINSKKVYFIVPFALASALFAFCGLLTGSRIFILILVFIIALTIFLRFGKKRWWIATLVVVGFLASVVALLMLPVFTTIRNRLILL